MLKIAEAMMLAVAPMMPVANAAWALDTHGGEGGTQGGGHGGGHHKLGSEVR